MRVLHIYAGNLYGGVESALATLARERAVCPSMRPHFALCFEGRLAREIRESGAPLAMLGEARISRPWTVAAARKRLRDLLDLPVDGERGFDVAICHSYWPHGMFAPVLRSRGIPLVYWAHDVPTGKSWLERWARRTVPDLVLANSEFTAKSIDKLFPGVRVEVQRVPVTLRFPVDRDRVRAEVRKQLGAPEGACVIITACRLERWKGHTLLLDALAELRDVPNWQCWIAGGPQSAVQEDYLAELKTFVKKQRIDSRVKFLGQRDDVPNLLVAADVHCQPNTGPEPFGIAYIEALYAGLPVVTTDFGAAPEIVSESCGRLVAAETRNLACELRALIRSPESRRALGQAGPFRARELCDVECTTARLAASVFHLARAEMRRQ